MDRAAVGSHAYPYAKFTFRISSVSASDAGRGTWSLRASRVTSMHPVVCGRPLKGQAGLSHRAIVSRLAKDGFTTRKGTPLSLIQVQRILAQATSG
jgi:hypothetical protein